jgi:hypothetical protein
MKAIIETNRRNRFDIASSKTVDNDATHIYNKDLIISVRRSIGIDSSFRVEATEMF